MAENLDQARFIYETVCMLQRAVLAEVLSGQNARPSELDLTIPQMNTLATIRQHGQVSIKELAEAMGVSAPSASAMVDRLIDLGAVTREPSPSDRREVVVQTTPTGEGMARQKEELLLGALTRLLEAIGPAHARQWCEVYEKVRDVLNAEAPCGIGAKKDMAQ
ncbi:MAG: MarR family transcriptional regulator [Candidatus Hydrogenedentes bacterium]|nr:MarR family transcriptional regulator [Candidatus Hydrogenedentota bacterium]